MRHRDDGLRDRGVVGVARDVADERAVDLERCRSGSASDSSATNSRCRSRRSTGGRPSLATAFEQLRPRRSAIVHHHALGDLELERVRGRARFPPALLAMSSAGSSWRELARRQVHRHAQRRQALALPRAAFCAQAVRSTQSPIGTIRPVSSASGMNCAGRHRAAASGWFQRSSASTPVMRPLAQVDLGLVVQHELVALQRAAQRRFRAPGARANARSSARSRTGKLFLPCSLARYIAMSAFFSSVAASSAPSSG